MGCESPAGATRLAKPLPLIERPVFQWKTGLFCSLIKNPRHLAKSPQHYQAAQPARNQVAISCNPLGSERHGPVQDFATGRFGLTGAGARR